MEEKLDLKSKYEKLRKKYTTLKQQFGELKTKTEKYESEYKSLNNSYRELENKYNDCLANLDASQYKEAVLEREVEEMMCQLDQYKQQSELKLIKQNNSLNKTGNGILTGLLPVNEVIKNFQRDEKLEERISILQEELNSKISENEQLHIKEFDLKKRYKLELDELTTINEKLKKKLEEVMNELQYLKLKSSSEDNEAENLKQKSSDNELVEAIRSKLKELENQAEKKYRELRKLIPDINMKKLEAEHIDWLNMRRVNYYFNIKKISSLYFGLLELVLPIITSWESLVNESQNSFENELIERININVSLKLNQAIKNIKYTKTIFNNNISFERNIYNNNNIIGDDNKLLIHSTTFETMNEQLIEGFSLIYKALRLYILGFKMRIPENSEADNSLGTEKIRIVINNLSSLVYSMKELLTKIINMISFNIVIGKDPDIIYIDSRETSIYSEFLKLTDYIFSKIDLKNYLPEERHYFINLIRQVFMDESNFTEEKRIEVKREFWEPIERINKLEGVRRALHNQINERICKYIVKLSNNLSEIKSNIHKIFNSNLISNVINRRMYYNDSINTSIDNLLCYIRENTLNNKLIISSLYQHPSKVFLTGLNRNEFQIVMRETQSKLLNAPPRITLPEINILNKRIEQLEESKNQQIEVINNLKRQLSSNNEILLESDDRIDQISTSRKKSGGSVKSEQSNQGTYKASLDGNSSQIGIQGISESLLREANETLEYTVKRQQLEINSLNDDINITRRSYDEQISLLTQHISSLSEKLSQADASTTSSYNQEILCYSCETWNTLDSIMKKTKGGCEKCKAKLLRPK
ncbi:coiled coil [Cryptosporidium xiaoi]|uniref:Coiled coil n=1 Tax=Cryptosporidium xiaoi TaxID=659607 RepID=A0AAV9Y0H7_9CRYT